MFAICPLSIVPVRKEPSDRSELVTQLLFGEWVEILETQGNWQRVRILQDDYDGWLDNKQLTPVEESEALTLIGAPFFYTLETSHPITCPDGSHLHVVLGSHLPFWREHQFQLLDKTLLFAGQVTSPGKAQALEIRSLALRYLNTPYLWGGKTPFGIDCSGFTQMVFRVNGISLPRDAWQQANTGLSIDWEEGCQEGDLAFFQNAEGKVVHVGIVLANQEIIHASGQVRIDTLTKEGITHRQKGNRTHTLHSIKRFV